MASNGIAITPSRFHSAGRAIWIALTVQAGLRWGGWLRTNVYAACRGYVVVLVLGDLVTRRHFVRGLEGAGPLSFLLF